MYITLLAADLQPEQAARRLASRPGFAWLDGGLRFGREGRFSFLGVDPVQRRDAAFGQNPWAALSEIECAGSRIARDGSEAKLSADDVPQWIGTIAYDAWWSTRAGIRHARPQTPVLSFGRYDALLAYDHFTAEAFLVGDGPEACAQLRHKLLDAQQTDDRCTIGPIEQTADAAHVAAIEAALAHIRAGDIYQVNLARRYRAPFQGSPLSLYLRMRKASPVPLGVLLQMDTMNVLGCSMERFVRYRRRDGALWTSPIKGTIARGGRDEHEASALLADPKEHAEHAMIVDLMRNDLGQVSRFGSVSIESLMDVQPFAGLAHLVSTVRSVAKPELSIAELLEATFAPGSVTGTPKKRAMEIIEQLESHARGLYTGAYGFIDRAGGVSLAVAIRTATIADGHLTYFAGGGIVADSDPLRETEETKLKARVLLDACEKHDAPM